MCNNPKIILLKVIPFNFKILEVIYFRRRYIYVFLVTIHKAADRLSRKGEHYG